MSVLNIFKKIKAQVDPFDKGATFNNPQGIVQQVQSQPSPSPIQRVANTIYNDFSAPVSRGIQGAVQAINPWDAESKGNNLINQANQSYHFTPMFKASLDKANPQVLGKPLASNALTAGHNAIGLFDPNGSTNAINLTTAGGNNRTPISAQQTLVHEGLHHVWQTDPQERAKFIAAYNSSSTPFLREYLANSLAPYKDFATAPSDSLMNINKLPANLQNEAHSYIAESALNATNMDGSPVKLPPNLQRYYSQYYGAKKPAQQNGILDYFHKLGQIF